MWMSAAAAPRGRIPLDVQLRPGLALGIYGDGGWGTEVERVRRRDDEAFGDDLVAAAAEAVGEWHFDERPAWVTAVPSRSGERVVDFGARLADALGLPFHDVVRTVAKRRPQSELENSYQQLANFYATFKVEGDVPTAPVLLVDDIVGSGWTLTVVGVALREAGSGPVVPFVLARAVSE